MRQALTRRALLARGAAVAVGTTLASGALGAGAATARPRAASLLRTQMAAAADAYDVPVAVLLAMGHVNTRLEMPPPDLCAFRRGDPEARGAYGVMALVRNPWEDTLGLAAELTRLPPGLLRTDLAANVRGGAALLAHVQGPHRPSGPHEWLGAVAGHRGLGPTVQASAGVGGGDDYAGQVAAVLDRGFTNRLSSGERVALLPGGGA